MKIEEETRSMEGESEGLCPYAEFCPDSDYGNDEICSNNHKICSTHSRFENGDIKIIKLPLGVCQGSYETFIEKYLRLTPTGVDGRTLKTYKPFV